VNAEIFFQQIIENAALPPPERHARFSELHHQITTDYLAALHALDAQRAAQPVQSGAEVRSVAQVVGHIMEWERFMILSAGDMLAGLRQPRMVTNIEGYVEPEGQTPRFENIEAFNTYQANKHSAWAWEKIQSSAIDTASTLHTLFTQPGLLTAERLENTQPFRKRLPNGAVIQNIAMGWNLWVTCLEHEGVEHARDLGMSH